MRERYEVVVIGAGPAGMSAARVAVEGGASVAVFDEQGEVGGQIYRGIPVASLKRRELLGESYAEGVGMAADFMQTDGVDYFSGASVWNLDAECIVSVLYEGISYEVVADKVIICVGAQERPMPIKGWELPGVMTAGAGQILLKTGGLVPANGVILAGSGPLLLLLACQYLKAGVEIKAILDTTPKGRLKKGGFYLLSKLFRSNYYSGLIEVLRIYWQWFVSMLQVLFSTKRGRWHRLVQYFSGSFFAFSYLWTGLKMILKIRRNRVRVVKYVNGIRAEGESALKQVQFTTKNICEWQGIETDTLLLHHGVMPQLQLAMVAGCSISWDEVQNCWQVGVNAFGESSVAGIFVAGDGARIIGATASAFGGEVSGLRVLLDLDKIGIEEFDKRHLALAKLLKGHLSIRPFLDRVYRPSKHFLVPYDDVLICRCEGITAGEVRQVAKTGCLGPNQMKAFTRCGMGACQGRMCGMTVSAIIADEQSRLMEDVGYYRVRPPVKSISLGEIGR